MSRCLDASEIQPMVNSVSKVPIGPAMSLMPTEHFIEELDAKSQNTKRM